VAKTLCSPDLVEAICRHLRIGAYRKDAVKAAGVGLSTFYYWIERGGKERRHIDSGRKARKREGAYLAALECIEKAEAESCLSDLAVITKASMDGAWQAAAWKLERRNPEQWGRQRLDIQASGQLIVEGAGWLSKKIDTGNG
jgi:transposase